MHRYQAGIETAFPDLSPGMKHALDRTLDDVETALRAAVGRLQDTLKSLDFVRDYATDPEIARNTLARVLDEARNAGASGPAPSQVAKAYALIGVAKGIVDTHLMED